MARILRRPRAQAYLVEIWNFIADDSEARADAFVDALEVKLASIAHSPNIGRPRSELAEGMRSFPVGRYVIF